MTQFSPRNWDGVSGLEARLTAPSAQAEETRLSGNARRRSLRHPNQDWQELSDQLLDYALDCASGCPPKRPVKEPVQHDENHPVNRPVNEAAQPASHRPVNVPAELASQRPAQSDGRQQAQRACDWPANGPAHHARKQLPQYHPGDDPHPSIPDHLTGPKTPKDNHFHDS